MVDRLGVAPTSKEVHLCKVALRSPVEADIERNAFTGRARLQAGGTHPEKVVEARHYRGGRVTPQADDKKLGEQHEHLDKV